MSNFTKQKFQWFIDLSTSSDTMQVVRITAGGERVRRRLIPFFSAYKYYKLGSVKVKFIPASTLPVDPTGLSLQAGENTVDPRDQFNPGLVRITNGEDFNDDQTNISGEYAEQYYYTLMLDQRWYKFNLQSGFRRSAVPLYWNVGQLHQDVFPGAIQNLPNISKSSATPPVIGNYNTGNQEQKIENGSIAYNNYSGSDPRSLFQVGGKSRMGWMPTDSLYSPNDPDLRLGSYAQVPEVELLRVILPKAYKTKFYYRLYIEETVMFKQPVTMYASNSTAGNYFPVSLDRFVYPVGTSVGPTGIAVPRQPINGQDWHNDGNEEGEN